MCKLIKIGNFASSIEYKRVKQMDIEVGYVWPRDQVHISNHEGSYSLEKPMYGKDVQHCSDFFSLSHC